MTATAPVSSNRLREALGATYSIDRELGRGGMATVYLAQDLRHERLVALKVLHRDVAETLGAERFLREIKTAARLNHPHILPLFDSGAADEFLYYVMPYVEGESLRQALDRLGQIPVDDAIAYTREMAAALDYAHRQGIVHRDIKPENVMLHEGIAMLMDFGIAKAVEKTSSENLTMTGMVIGTPAYMSPEQAFAGSDLDGRSDQYSLACMVHEMISGRQLFAGVSPHAVIAKRLAGTAPDFADIAERVSPEVMTALARAMSLEARDRFDTMREFASAVASGGRNTPASIRFEAPAISASKSVAVLPFENLSADPENEYLADGIAEEIINALSKVRTLRVASRASSFAMKGRRDDLQEAGRKLKVSTVLNGSVRRAGNRIRVTAELVNVSDGSQLWAERYDREMEDVFAIQDDISEAIVRALRVILGDAERKALKARTRDIRAYEYYLRGRQYQDLRKKSVEYAMEMFQHAIGIDPEYASAYAGIADCLSLKYLLFDPDMSFVDEAKKYAETALTLEPELAEAHLARAMAYSCVRDYPTSNMEFEKAMKLDPKLFEVPYYWGRNLHWQGRTEEAIRIMRVALSLRPESWDVAMMMAMMYTGLGKTAEAGASRNRAMKLVKDYLELNPDDSRAWILSSVVHAAAGDRESSETAIARAFAIDTDALTVYNAACTYALLHDRDKALDTLELAVKSGYRHKQWLQQDSDFDFVRNTDRFQRLLASLG